MTAFDLAVLAVAILSGATASMVGFGIGSLLTPLLASQLGTGTAVAAVMVPHAIATAFRAWRLRASIDWGVMKSFGLLSALGGLAGAALYAQLGSKALTKALGVLLVLTAIAQLTGMARRLKPRGGVASALGFCSGVFGGVAGNQGGLRSAALMAFDLEPRALIATATGVGLLVDAARAPIYLWNAGDRLMALGWPLSLATAGVLVGTLVGERILMGVSRERFANVIAVSVGLLGLWLVVGV